MLKLRLYNAVLQGQFRHSSVTYERSELGNFVTEFWVGASYELSNHLRISGFIRSRSAEIIQPDAREPVLGGILVSKSF